MITRRLRLWRGVWLALLLWLAAGVPLAAAETLTAAEYYQLLARIRLAVGEGGDRAALADELAEIDGIEAADGRRIPLDTAALVAQLRDEAVTAATLDTALSAELAARAAAGVPPAADPAATLADVLARPEFDYAPQDENWRDWLQRQFLRWWYDLLEFFFGNAEPSSGGVISVALLLALLGVLLYVWLRGIRRSFVPQPGRAAGNPFDEHVTPAEAQALAQQHAEAGRYREALRYLYLAALLTLDERDVLRFDRSKTNREYLRALRPGTPRTTLEPLLRQAVERFDRVWYGFEPIDRTGYDEYSATIAQLTAAPVEAQP